MSKKATFPWRVTGGGLTATAFGVLLGHVPWQPIQSVGYVLDAGGAAAVVGAGAVYYRHYSSTIAVLNRARRRAVQNNGTGTRRQHWSSSSKRAMRRQARAILPKTTAGMSQLDRYRLPISQYAMYQGREAKLGKVYSSREDVVVLLGGPRRGKSAMMACYVTEAPGACIVTSTRNDLATITRPSREAIGPIHIFDPSGAGGLGNTIKWPVLSGCKHPGTAMRRARAMIPRGANGEIEKWNQLARNTLAVLMLAAAIRGSSMYQVMSWAARPTQDGYRQDVEDALAQVGDAAHVEGWMELSNQFFGNNDRTRTSITTTLTDHLTWLLDPGASVMGAAVDDLESTFSVKELLDTKGTVYMIGDKDDGVAPLVAALVDEIGYQSRIIAMAAGGRLEPPLTLVLDEAANICPIPLDRWTSFMGGHNITVAMSAQDPSQLVSIWGLGAQSIMDHAATLVIFGGIQDADFLEDCVRKCDIIVEATSDAGEMTTGQQRIPTITPAEIMSLPKHRALVFRSGMSYVIVDAPNIYKRKDIAKLASTNRSATIEETRWEEKLADTPADTQES